MLNVSVDLADGKKIQTAAAFAVVEPLQAQLAKVNAAAPPVPATLDATGVSPRNLLNLLLKFMHVEGCENQLDFADRALVTSINKVRDIGLMAHGTWKIGKIDNCGDSGLPSFSGERRKSNNFPSGDQRGVVSWSPLVN